ncbi:MAG: NUDIX domain-containing protein [Thermomicrobiales bacterium]
MTTAGAGHTPEMTVESRLGFHGRLINVRVDTVRLPGGRETMREVVEHPGAVAVIALTTDHHVLLVRQYRHSAGKTLLELPAGTIEPEEPPAETARRELIEETGFVPGRLTELVAFHPTPGYSSERITLFLAEECRPAPNAATTDEVIDVVTLPFASIRELLLPGPNQVEDGKTLIGLFWLLNADAFELFGAP